MNEYDLLSREKLSNFAHPNSRLTVVCSPLVCNVNHLIQYFTLVQSLAPIVITCLGWPSKEGEGAEEVVKYN